jgi:hypothetical protein
VYSNERILVLTSNFNRHDLKDESRLGAPAVDRLIEPPSTLVEIKAPSMRVVRKLVEEAQGTPLS